jgi:hypothetical protein
VALGAYHAVEDPCTRVHRVLSPRAAMSKKRVAYFYDGEPIPNWPIRMNDTIWKPTWARIRMGVRTGSRTS